MDCLITGATVVTCDDERRILDDAAVLVRADRIAAVGPSAALEAAHPDAPRWSGRGKAVLPGLINAHTHTVLTVLRGTVEDMSGDAVYGYMVPISYAMTPGERSAMSVLGCLEALRSGATTLVENFRHVPTYAGAIADLGLRLVLSENAADAVTTRVRHGEYVYDRAWGQEFLDRSAALIEGYHGTREGRVTCQVAAHATDNCSPWMLGELMALARRHGLTRTVHLAQSQREVDQVRSAHRATPAGYLDREGWLDRELVGAHWTFCTEDDIALLAERGAHLAHCPANSSRRGPHRVLAAAIRDAGVNIAFGTDNMTEDMFQAMHVGSVVHRGSYGGGVRPGPQAILDAVTRNGAASIGRLADLGSVEPGKKADLTILDLDTPAMRPVISLVSNIVHYGHPGVVHSVMVDGTFLLEDRRVLCMDEAGALDEAEAAARSAWRRLHRDSPDIEPPQGCRWL